MTEGSVLIGDAAVTTVPVFDCGEPLLDAMDYGIATDDRLADEFGYYRRLRAGVLRRLRDADLLLPRGLHCAVIEGYRPISTQYLYFESYRAELAAAYPDVGADELFRLTTRHIAPVLPDGHPPHSTGGAVDLTLFDAFGQEVPMGCPVNATPEQSEGACYTAAPGLTSAHRGNRDMLVAALSAAGLVNYAPEWWHWSFGDQYWALRTGAEQTRYARVVETARAQP